MPGENINSGSEAPELSKEQQDFLNLGQEVPFAGAKPETEHNEARFVKLENLEDACSLENCVIYGHGTASAGDEHEIVENIFEEGIKGFESEGNIIGEDRDAKISGSTDLLNQADGIWASQEGEFDSEAIKDKLDHWRHRNPRNIILIRLPQEYIHSMTNVHEETFKPFYTVHEDATGHKNNYLDRRLIIGNYDTTTGLVELNDNFESEISNDFKTELDNRLASAKAETAARHAKFDQQDMPGIDYTNNQPDEAYQDLGEFDFDDWGDYSEEDWE